MSAVALAEAIRRRELSATESVLAAIDTIERVDPRVHAVVAALFERAVEKAATASGPFAGVPLLLKDAGQELAGTPHWVGLAALRDAGHVSSTTTPLAAALERLGFVVVGKAAVPELSAGVTTEPAGFEATRNPWHLSRTVGGSSGGSAAAVSAGMVPVAHGADGTGSLRFPASCCGVVTLRPSALRVATVPPAGLGDPLGVWREFVLARSIADLMAVLSALTEDTAQTGGHGDPRPPVRPLRIGLLDSDPLLGIPLEPQCADAARRAATVLEALGHHVGPSWPPSLTGLPARVAAPISLIVDAARATQVEWVATRLGRAVAADDVPLGTLESAARGRAAGPVAVGASMEAVRVAVEAVPAWWDDHDVLLTPTMRRAPWPLGEVAGPLHCGMFAAPFSFTGQPCLALPVHVDDEGVPIGVQLVGRVGDDDLLLRLGRDVEAAVGGFAAAPSAAARARTEEVGPHVDVRHHLRAQAAELATV